MRTWCECHVYNVQCTTHNGTTHNGTMAVCAQKQVILIIIKAPFFSPSNLAESVRPPIKLPTNLSHPAAARLSQGEPFALFPIPLVSVRLLGYSVSYSASSYSTTAEGSPFLKCYTFTNGLQSHNQFHSQSLGSFLVPLYSHSQSYSWFHSIHSNSQSHFILPLASLQPQSILLISQATFTAV